MRSDIVAAYLDKHGKMKHLYNRNMKCNILVKGLGAERHKGTFSDGIETWYPFVIDSPESNEKELNYNFEEKVMAIGMTGWDYALGQTHWVAFDFDSIANHKAGLSPEELDSLLEKAKEIPWVSIRKSTSGLGYHFYVHFEEPIDTEDHQEHAAVSRAVLSKMSALSGFNFANSVDICGGNMWIYHEKDKGDGFTLIKQGEELTSLENWQEHIPNIKKKNRPGKKYDNLISSMSMLDLDSEHTKLFHYLDKSQASWWWDSDSHMLVCHTVDLKKAHEELGFKGSFETDSSHSSDINCFMFPLAVGGWSVRRFSPGVNEHPLWEQDGEGWTKCNYNVPMTLRMASRLFGGLETPKGGYLFNDASQMALAAHELGVFFDLPNKAPACSGELKEMSDGRLEVSIIDEAELLNLIGTWIKEKKKWIKIFNKVSTEVSETDAQYDDVIRHVVANGENQGWFVKMDKWVNEPIQHIKFILDSKGLKAKDRDKIIGNSVMNCWDLVSIPFSKEYPGGRRWNKNCARLAYTPSNRTPLTFEEIPFWGLLFKHIGRNLDRDVLESQWCRDNGIFTGADYLIYWVASMFQFPERALPYLFIFSKEQGTGKTLFTNALSSLMVNGHQIASSALEDRFNDEIASAVLCLVEEIDLGGNKAAANKMKEWVTNEEILIRARFKTPYTMKNLTHWIQLSNDHNACPIFTGDTRVVAIELKPFTCEEIPIDIFRGELKKNAPDFLAFILNLSLPKPVSRFGIPVLDTSNKQAMQERNKTMLELYIDEKCHLVEGASMTFSDFYNGFTLFLSDSIETWSRIKVSKELPPSIIKGRSDANVVTLGNISSVACPRDGRYILKDGKLLKRY